MFDFRFQIWRGFAQKNLVSGLSKVKFCQLQKLNFAFAKLFQMIQIRGQWKRKFAISRNCWEIFSLKPCNKIFHFGTRYRVFIRLGQFVSKIEIEKCAVCGKFFLPKNGKAFLNFFLAQLACEFAWICKYLQASCIPHF